MVVGFFPVPQTTAGSVTSPLSGRSCFLTAGCALGQLMENPTPNIESSVLAILVIRRQNVKLAKYILYLSR